MSTNRAYTVLQRQHFIAGDTQKYIFEIFDKETMQPADLNGATARYTLANQSSKTVVLTKQGNIIRENNDIVKYPYKVSVVLESAETVHLYGPFIQQLQITDFFGQSKEPAEGEIVIQRNNEPIVNSEYWYDNIQKGSFYASPNKYVLPLHTKVQARLFYVNSLTEKLATPLYSDLSFTSSDPAVAQVENSSINAALITAVGVGQCEVIVKTISRPDIFTVIRVSVEDLNNKWYDNIKAGSFRFTPLEINMAVDSSQQVALLYTNEVTGHNAMPDFTDIGFESENTDIVTVDNSGFLYGVAVGTGVVTAYVLERPEIQAQLIVNVAI